MPVTFPSLNASTQRMCSVSSLYLGCFKNTQKGSGIGHQRRLSNEDEIIYCKRDRFSSWFSRRLCSGD
jgi:hypothetical protein